MILLGSVQRYELERILLIHLSHDQKIIWNFDQKAQPVEPKKSQNSSSASAVTVISEVVEPVSQEKGNSGEGEVKNKPRFQVTRVDKSEEEKMKDNLDTGDGPFVATDKNIPMQLLAVVMLFFFFQ